MQRLLSVAPGFDASGLLTLQVQTSGQRYRDVQIARRFFLDALESVRQVPGVAAAAFTSQLPLSGDVDKYGVQLESSRSDAKIEERDAFRYAVTAGYFEMMGIPLRAGRLFDDRDVADSAPVVLISESMAKRRFRGRDPDWRAGSRRADRSSVVHDRRRGGRREAGVVVGRAVGWRLHAEHAVAFRRPDLVARRPCARERGWTSCSPFVRRSGRWTRISRSSASRRWKAGWRPRLPSGDSR